MKLGSLPILRVAKNYHLLPTLPIEVKVTLFFSLLWAGGIALGLPISLPDMFSLKVIESHYFRPIFIAFLLQAFIVCLKGIITTGKKYEPFLTLKLLYFMAFSIFLHFNFKAWMPLINSHLFDECYNKIDQYLWPLLQFFLTIRQFIASQSPFTLDSLYHHLFVAMFFISFSAHALFDNTLHQRQLVLGVCLILLIGGISYWIAPAAGAFLYRNGVSSGTLFAQKSMYKAFLSVKTTGLLPPGYFAVPLAAMPSLHIAHALLFTFFAGRSCRWLLLLFIPIMSWLIIESVSSAWHYLVDLPFGALICFVCIKLVFKWLPESDIKERKCLDQ